MAPAASFGASPMETTGATSNTSSDSSSTFTPAIVGAGIGAGVLILAIIIGVAIRIHVVRKRHRIAMAAMEHYSAAASPSRHMEQLATVRHGNLVPIHPQGGWDELGSSDTINEPEPVARPEKRKRTSSGPKRMKSAKAIGLRTFKHLSAIIESPRIEPPPSPSPLQGDDKMASTKSLIGQAHTADHAIESVDITDARSESPKPDVLPSFAIDSPARYGAAIANDQGHPAKQTRSMSSDAESAQRPEMHARSVSLGAPTSRPPSGPVPPIPTSSSPPVPKNGQSPPHIAAVSRQSSSSSTNSAGSSVLATSPVLKMRGRNRTPPSVEKGERGQRQNAKITGPRPNIRPRISPSARMRQLSLDSTSSSSSHGDNRLSIPQIATADHVSISRVSSSNSIAGSGSAGRVRKIETPPRRTHRQSGVSASGSPQERDRRNRVLRDISGNANGAYKRRSPARRHLSVSSQGSARSSNGNPFQWDPNTLNDLPKPSALKGSPNARKTHRWHNCVRISTLTPEVLGGRSRSSSPASIAMDQIAEERESDDLKREAATERAEIERVVAKERRRSRPPPPPRNVSNEDCLRVQTLRASLTPSSPTLSSWTAYNEQQDNSRLPSQPSDSYLSVSPNLSRPDSKQSDRSSFTIPKFPSPSKSRPSIAVTVPQPDTAPMPEFSIDLDIESPTLGFYDSKHGSSPFGLLSEPKDEPTPVSPAEPSSDSPVEFSPISPMDLPSSPPLPISKVKEYDPNWLPVVAETPSGPYDPASPPFVWTGFDSVENEKNVDIWGPVSVKKSDIQVSPKSRAPVKDKEDSPPLSPKSMSSAIPDLTPKEKLTSENASAMMSKVSQLSSTAQPSSTSSFLGTKVPVLAPSNADDTDVFLPQWEAEEVKEQQAQPLRPRTSPPRVARPTPLATIPQSSSPPPLSLRSNSPDKPNGPRNAPAKSVLKNVSALRRMNSDVRASASPSHRSSRNFVRLGREPSPELPWEAEGEGEGNDASSASSSSNYGEDEAERRQRDSIVPQVDLARMTRTSKLLEELSVENLQKMIDGALQGFDAEHRASIAWSGEMTPLKGQEQGGEKGMMMLSTPASFLSIGATPKSLYDADGFLK